MQDGRKANAWFRKCRPEWQALRHAVFNGNTHAAAAAKRSFNAAKRRAKRAIDRQVHKRLLHDLRHNPRKFWTAYKGRTAPCVLDDPAGFDAHWRKLYGSSGQHSLPECATSVSEFMASLSGSGAASPGSQAATLNVSISVDEVESALLRMKNGRMAGPDGMRGELLKGAYSEWELPDGTFKHLFALSSELRDMLDRAFSTGEVPAVWNSAYTLQHSSCARCSL
jgi:hypothetical protein